MLRACAVVPLYPPNSRVGAWLSTHECLRALAARGHEVTVVAYLAKPERYRIDGIEVFGSRFALQSVLNRKTDVVISHAGDNGTAHRWAIEHRVPSVVMVHGTPTAETQRRFIDRPPTVTITNAFATSELCRWIGDFEVVYPPVWPKEHSTVPGNRVTLVNLSADKGVATFLQAARRLPNVPFLGVRGGYGTQRSVNRPNVKVVPATNDMRTDVWSKTRILLMPSRIETWGRVAIEAAASGIPTIASPTAGLREALGEAGTYVKPNDYRRWVAEIERLLDNGEWRTASALALKRSKELEPTSDLNRFVEIIERVAG